MPRRQVDSVWSYFDCESALSQIGCMGCYWCAGCAERHHEIGDARMQPLPSRDEERQEISLL